jgi:oligopeptide transport system substrate-binding protein
MAVLTAASLLAGCGGGGGSGGSGEAVMTVNGTEPQNPLLPANTNEVGGGRILDSIFSRLVRFDNKDGHPENEAAESIESPDSKTWTVKIKQGWKFHDGTPVTAKSFVDAWNYGAYGPNAQLNASFFAKIQGYDAVHPEDPDGESGPKKAAEPTAKTLSGLSVVDDNTFKVVLSAPFSLFSTMIGYAAFAPLPQSFFADPKAFGEKPIGNGPFKLDSWNHNTEINLSRNPDYQGQIKPKVSGVVFKLYTGLEAAYTDVQANNLDFMDTIPPNALPDSQFKKDLGEGRYDERPALLHNTLTIPLYDAKYKNPDFRRALSLAINRKEIADKIFHGSRKPMSGYGVSSLEGYQPGKCEFCEYDPAKAREYFQRSGVPASTDVGISYNSDGGHKEWIDAVCGSITNTLGVKCTPDPLASFAIQRQKATSREFKTMFRTGWQADYPALENFLTPIYRTGASSNDGEYTNPKVDAKLTEADQATDKQKALKLYVEAEQLILQDMPVIPGFERVNQSGWSARMKTVNVNAFGQLDLLTAEVK